MPELHESGLLTYYQAASGTSTLKGDVWYVNQNKQHAFSVFSDFDGLKEAEAKIVPETSPSELRSLNSFSTLDANPIAFRTTTAADLFDGEDITLDLDDRVLSVLMDQSGSMTWNDNAGVRHAVARRMVNRVVSTYPGDVTFNVIEYGGTPVEVTLFAIKDDNEIVGNDIQTINNAFFEDHESNFAGVRVVRKLGSFPSHPLDGDIVSEGFLSKSLSISLTETAKYFYKVFTFDKNFHFSDGIPISAVVRERAVPRGVSSASSDVLIGTGVVNDDNVIGAWHFDEGVGSTVYDFSGSGSILQVTPASPVWVDGDSVPVGASGLRFNSVDTQVSSSVTSACASADKLTIAAWIYPFDFDTLKPIVGRQTSTDANYLLYTDGRKLGFYNGSATVTSPNDVLVRNEWNHVAVTVDFVTGSVVFYVDGAGAGSATLSSLTTNAADQMNIDIGFDRQGTVTSSRFFGRITEVSIHNAMRSQTYLQQHANVLPNADNGDRLSVLKYNIPSDFNFNGGLVRIVRNDFTSPSWDEDGTIVADTVASKGEAIITDAFNLVLGSTVSYRVFSQNAIGNFSLLADSPLLEVAIPALNATNTVEPLAAPVFPPVTFTARVGNRKIALSWSNAVSPIRTRIYYSDSNFPVVGDQGQVAGQEASGELIFEGSSSDTKFVHRDIDNNVGAFYTIVNMDRLGRVSNPVNASAIPDADADEVGIPLLEVKNLSYEIVNNTSLSIDWDNPIEFKANIEGFFGDRILIYAAISDEFGAPISDDTQISMSIEPVINNRNQSSDVFGAGLGEANFEPEDTFQFAVNRLSNGVIRGILRMSVDTANLSFIESARFNVKVTSFIPDTESTLQANGMFSKNLFEFFSSPIAVELKNPWKMEISNRDGRKVNKDCPVPLDDVTLGGAGLVELTEEKSFDGAYVRSTIPFVARVKLSFRDEPLPPGNSIKVDVWDATTNVCSDNFEPTRTRRSSVVLAPSTTLIVQDGFEEELDEQGVPTGTLKGISFVDVPLGVPDFPQGAIIFAQGAFGGFVSTVDFYMLFENILVVDLTARAPISDGIDVAEQQAVAYLIDPDFPEDESRRTFPTDLSVVRWRLIKKDFAQDRPFYSTDNVNITSGIFSFSRSGIAKNVFFGPASGVEWHYVVDEESETVDVVGERYEVSASVVFDGLSADDSKPVEIFPLGRQQEFGARILMEFPVFKNTIFGDGEDFAKLVISRNPNTSLTRFSTCFRSCAEGFEAEILELNVGQFVTIVADDQTEILHGNIIETIDPYTGDNSLSVGTGGLLDVGSALVEIEDDNETVVYFRIKGFFPPLDSAQNENPLAAFAGLLNPCSCLGIEQDTTVDYEKVVTGSTTILVNNQAETLIGGGEMASGIPPTILVAKEPLEIEIVNQLVNGSSSDQFVIDGTSTNAVVIEVSFAGKPVPNATPVSVITVSEKTGGISKLNFPQTIFTQTKIDPNVDSINERSYATLVIDPVSPEEELFEQIIFTTTYDKSGEIDRIRTTCAKVEWSPGDFETSLTPNIFSGQLERYDETGDAWTSLSTMQSPRGHLTLDHVSGRLYAIGGIDSKTISKFTEEYSVATDTWIFRGNMPTPRFAAMSVTVGSRIFVIGGVSADEDTSELVVTRAVEVYDTTTDNWEVLTSMPVVADGSLDGRPYGVAFGVARRFSVSGDRIYVLCGVTELDENGRIVKYNDRVLYYDIASDTWTVEEALSGLPLELFKRVAPNVIVDSGRIIVVGGAFQPDDQTEEGLVYLTDSFQYNLSSRQVSLNDFEFTKLPLPRYKGASVNAGASKVFFFGGSNNNSQNLNVSDSIDISSSPFTLTSVAPMQKGRTGHAAADDGSTFTYVAGGFVSGRDPGFLSINTDFTPSEVRLDGKKSAAIQLKLTDDTGQLASKAIKLVVRGFVKFVDTENAQSAEQTTEEVAAQQSEQAQRQSAVTIDERLAIYPVLFTSTELTTSGGKATITLLPRSDDFLKNVKDVSEEITAELKETGAAEVQESESEALIVIEPDVIRKPYQILVQVTIDDDEFYGQTIEDLGILFQDSELPTDPNAIDESIAASGGSPTGDPEDCENVIDLNVSIAFESFSRGISLEKVDALSNSTSAFGDGSAPSVFSLIPTALGQGSSPIFQYFSDIAWIPSVTTVVSDNSGTATEALAVMENMQNSIAFGASPMFDALFSVARTLQDNIFDAQEKVIYSFTDNEASFSVRSIDESIAEVNAIDGEKKVPVVNGLFSVVSPATLSSKANLSDIDNLNRIADETGGTNLTVLSEEFVDDTVGILFGEAVGSMGYGLYEFVYDTGSVSTIQKITSYFQLFDNTTGQWQIAVSEDGFTFTQVEGVFKPNVQITFSQVRGRFIKFTFVLTTGFAASNDPQYELIPLPAAPAVTQVEIILETEQVSRLFLNAVKAASTAQQVAVAVDASDIDPEQIQVGVAKSESNTWTDFSTPSQPTVSQNGKIFIPIRPTQDVTKVAREPLQRIDSYTFRAEYGRWDPEATLTVYNEDGTIIPSTGYRAYPRDGTIVLNASSPSGISVEVANTNYLRVGVQFTNRSSADPIEVTGIGYFYNTNADLLPPAERIAPEAKQVVVVPDEPTVFAKLTASYEFEDVNRDIEDIAQSEIRWYINNVRTSFLDNLTSWNDISNTSDPLYTNVFTFDTTVFATTSEIIAEARRKSQSIVKPGDTVYFTVRVSDGELFGDIVQSNIVTVAEESPLAEGIIIRAQQSDGAVSNVIRGQHDVFVEFNLVSDTGVNNSDIAWFVNGDEFKRGVVGVDENADRILPGELGSDNVLALAFNNEIFVEVTPKTDGVSGEKATSDSVIVQNSLPLASNVVIGPTNPRSAQDLVASFTFGDYDSSVAGDQTQSNQSMIQWFFRAGTADSLFTEVTELNGESIVPSSFTSRGQQWKVRVTPNDSLDSGVAVDSSIVTVT